MKFSAAIALALFFVLNSNALSAPFLEPQVRDFLITAQQSPQKQLPVLLVFRSAASQMQAIKAAKNRESRSLAMQKANLAQIELWRKKSPWVQSLTLDPLWIINGAFAHLSPSQIKDLETSEEIQGIYFSKKPYRIKAAKNAALDLPADYTYGLKKIGVQEMHKSFPHLNGAGVRVGILDTGIAINHPDLAGKLHTFKNFSPATDNSPRDDFGHGTHVAGTIAGGSASRQAIGVAPGAQLIVGRIFDGNGGSDRELILKSMQWMADPDENPATPDFAQVVNSSWSDDEPYADRDPENEPFCQVVQSWVGLDMIPVFSAGNAGPEAGTINLPAGCPEAFAVGATEQNDRSPHFSSTGPAIWKSILVMKPEVCAPGFNIKSARNSGGYEEMSGTSMAAPHVAGAFAILLQAYPQKSAEEIKTAMLAGAKDLGASGQDATFGCGRIDLVKSLEKLKTEQ